MMGVGRHCERSEATQEPTRCPWVASPSARNDGHVSPRARAWSIAAIALCLGLSLPAPARAVEPDEILKDPALEARARSVSEGLRCLVCQNESIDESHAALARDIRLLVRQRLEAGDSNAQVTNYLVARYGQFILLKPPFEPQTLLLWGTPVIVLLLGGAAMLVSGRRKPLRDPARPLSDEERQRLDDVLGQRETPGSAERPI